MRRIAQWRASEMANIKTVRLNPTARSSLTSRYLEKTTSRERGSRRAGRCVEGRG